MKIRPVGAELFHADRRTDMAKLIVAFQNFSKVPKKKKIQIIKRWSREFQNLNTAKINLVSRRISNGQPSLPTQHANNSFVDRRTAI